MPALPSFQVGDSSSQDEPVKILWKHEVTLWCQRGCSRVTFASGLKRCKSSSIKVAATRVRTPLTVDNFHPDYILPLGRYKTASGFYNHLETIHTEKKTHFFSLQLPRHTPDREKQLFDLFICLCRSVPENWVVQTEDKLAVRPSVGLCVANGYSLRSSLLLLENIMEGLIFKYLCHIFKEQRFEAKEFWRVQYMVY